MGRVTQLQKKGSLSTENILAPMTLMGILIPWNQGLTSGRESDFKLVTSSGGEYFIEADHEWRGVLSWYKWEEVKVVGLLNLANRTLIPQKVYPKGPKGEREKVVHLNRWKSRDLAQKIVRQVTELILVPAAVLAVMAS